VLKIGCAEIDRRTFLLSGTAALAAACIPARAQEREATQTPPRDFSAATDTLNFQFSVNGGRLRQGLLMPQGYTLAEPQDRSRGWGVEVALLLTGENSTDPGMKEAGGEVAHRLRFVGQSPLGNRGFSFEQHSEDQNLKVVSHYRAFQGVPVVRRYVEIGNMGSSPVGIEYLSSAMLQGFADPTHFDDNLKIWIAFNSWMSEGQWHCLRPSEMGFVESGRVSWSQAWAGSVGSWSTEKFLPMAVIENARLGLSWFWQIEHNGSWHWEISNESDPNNAASDVYAYLGGPDALHAQAWKNLLPGSTYRTVPVAVGCVAGGFQEAVQALTQYREQYCVPQRPARSVRCPVIFNDYMNCLWGDPTEQKELPLIDAAAAAGCEYFVIDAGWYAERNEDWSSTVGSWMPSKSRWPHGLQYVLDSIRRKHMVPGLWLEPEVAGMHSTLAQKPDNWFFMRHGKRVVKNSRLFLDFRNPLVRDHLNGVVKRLVEEYKVGYIKMDYNADTMAGTELDADSFGQGLLGHNRAVQDWLTGIRKRYPDLVIENCASGGGRMDYAMLSRTDLQSCTDQEDYRRLPAIATGSTAGVAPVQLAIWTYPKRDADPDQASFNMVTAMLCRIHQSGDLASLQPAAMKQVENGIRVYKEQIRAHIPGATPFYPLGMPDVDSAVQPISLGMRASQRTFIAVWRLSGPAQVKVKHAGHQHEILYPHDLGIQLLAAEDGFVLSFPRENMGCIVAVQS